MLAQGSLDQLQISVNTDLSTFTVSVINLQSWAASFIRTTAEYHARQQNNMFYCVFLFFFFCICVIKLKNCEILMACFVIPFLYAISFPCRGSEEVEQYKLETLNTKSVYKMVQ